MSRRGLGVIDSGQKQLDSETKTLKRKFGAGFVNYDPVTAEQTLYYPDHKNAANDDVVRPEADHNTPEKLREYFLDKIDSIRRGEVTHAIFPVDFIKLFTREEIAQFETEGIVTHGISDKRKRGGIYVKGTAEKTTTRLPHEIKHIQDETLEAIVATGVLKPATKLITHAPRESINPKELAGLNKFEMNSMVAAVYKDGTWTKSELLPDGETVRGGFDDTNAQYGQGAFEGTLATHDGEMDVVQHDLEVSLENGKVNLFRLEENAHRFISSCIALKMPPISVNQFIQAVIAAVQANKKFIPPNGKLYIRPYILGLHGGTGVKPAKQYIFGVECSPFGGYLTEETSEKDPDILPGIFVKSVTLDRPEIGKKKVAPNYVPVFKLKEEAKKQRFNRKNKFTDVLLITGKGEIQECGSSNFFLIEKHDDTDETEYMFNTTSLQANILPGVTRNSLITLLRDPKIQQRINEQLGRKIKISVNDDKILDESKIETASGAFGTGTAAGITNITGIKTRDNQSIEFKDHETQKLIKIVFDILQEARRGKIPGYEKWVMKV